RETFRRPVAGLLKLPLVNPAGQAPAFDRRLPQTLPAPLVPLRGLAGDARPRRVRADRNQPRTVRPQLRQARVFGQDGFDLLEQVKRPMVAPRPDVRLNGGDLGMGDRLVALCPGDEFRPGRAPRLPGADPGAY